ncbi:phospholipase D family protein [Mesorhizobium sp. CN2-181]|uniref:phospholipase D family protein n=1 Tax=Mesorhizobium yinganensis TaxID=3157707 RepID=UPI0032B7E780
MDLGITQSADDRIKAGKTGLQLVSDNFDAMAVRVLAARSAIHSLDLMYYLWHDDHSGRALMQEVVCAAERGIRVRILLDDMNPQMNDGAYLALNAHENIELKLFNPSGLRNGSWLRYFELVSRLFAMTRRMHHKAWLVDRRLAIVGGRNIGDAYFGAAETNFRDLDFLLQGAAVQQTQDIFEAYWNCAAARRIDTLHILEPALRAGSLSAGSIGDDDKIFGNVSSRMSIDEFIAIGNSVHWTENARVISDPVCKVFGNAPESWLISELSPILAGSQSNLQIVSPYFIPGRAGLSLLAGLVERGVDVSVLTNSLAATDVAFVHGAYANYRVPLLKAGINLFELQPFNGERNISVFGSKGASLHTKAFTVDGRVGFVGSFNFDPRSVSLNSEMGVLFEDEGLTAELNERIEGEKAAQTSYRVLLEGGQLRWRDDVDGSPCTYRHEPGASIYRKSLAGLVRYLPIESQL